MRNMLWALLSVIGIALLAWWFIQSRVDTPKPARDTTSTAPTPAVTQPVQADAVFVAESAFRDCVVPEEPMVVPDGATASIEQMRAGRTSGAAYDAATNIYLRCVDSTASQISRQDNGAAYPVNVQAMNALGIQLHNAAVDKDRALADRLNQQIRIFKAKHPP